MKTILTDFEIADICLSVTQSTSCDIAYARAIEAAIVEKVGEAVNFRSWEWLEDNKEIPLYAIPFLEDE